MLSQNLRTLAEHLRPYAATGMQASPSAMVMICAIVESAIEDAEELEARSVPKIERHLGALPSNVVRLSTLAAQQNVCTGAHPQDTSNPEDAA